ncbi:DUF5667 domain-containing protein [Kitasatospora sp. NPDC096147]|uniref:DUF5667 domain-containing protein n=1 Tax=Kitasatospora sp. NPDC096147 TaxID=3364093 RepID=UPI00382C295F
MTANMLEHRRARAFAEALEAHHAEPHQGDLRSDGGRPTGSTAMAELLDMAGALGALPGPELGGEARSLQRAQLMAAFEREWVAPPTARVPQQRRHRAIRAGARRRWGRRLAIGGLVGAVAVGSFAGAAAASSNALPGDTLYGMKRGLEDLRLSWAGSDSEVGALLLDQASTRLEEARGLLDRSDDGAALSPHTVEQVRRALDDMHAEALRGRELLRSVYRSNGSLDPMRRLADFASVEDGRWAAVQGQLPAQLTTQASRVNHLFDEVAEDVAPLRLVPAAGTAKGEVKGQQQSPGTGTAGSGAATGTTGGQSAAPDGQQSKTGGSGTGVLPKVPNLTGTGGSTAPGTGTGQGTTAPDGQQAKPSPNLLDKLLPAPLTGGGTGLTGGSSAGTPSAAPADRQQPSAAASPAGGGAPADQQPQQELRIPALIPGLLPEISLG